MKYKVLFVCLYLSILVSLSLWSQDVENESNGEFTEDEDTVWENIALIKKGSFEGADINLLSEIWRISPPEARLQIDEDVFLSGKASLRIESSGIVELRSNDIPIPSDAVSITGSLVYKGDSAPLVRIQWYKGSEILREDTFEKKASIGDKWDRFVLPSQTPPTGYTHLVLCIKAELPTQGKFWIDEVNLNLSIEQKKTVKILVNQIGYDLACPKRFVVATNFKPEKIKGILINSDNVEVAEVSLSLPEKIIGWNESDWGQWFFKGDFTPFDQEGVFRICLWINNKKYLSDEFVLGKDLIWEKTISVVLNGIRIHRCGAEVEGVHKLCHFDDNCSGKPLIGGWHNGYDYGKNKSGIVLSLLAEAYQLCKWRIKNSETLDKAFQEELNWGAKYILSRIQDDGSLVGNIEAKSTPQGLPPEKETDGNVGNDDDRTCGNDVSDSESCAYALSCLGYAFPDPAQAENFFSMGEKLTFSLIEKGKKGNLLFNSLVFLGERKGYDRYLTHLNALYPEDLIESAEAITRCEDIVGGLGTFNLGQAIKKSIEVYSELLKKNPFGICPVELAGSNSYFIFQNSPKPKGINEHILKIAQLAGKAFRFYPAPSVRELFFDQINWLLGVNPFGVSMINGIGKNQLSTLAHPYIEAGISPEQMMGCIPYGIRAVSEKVDIPYIDLAGSTKPDEGSLGVSIETMAMYINALAQYYKVRVHGGDTTNRSFSPVKN